MGCGGSKAAANVEEPKKDEKADKKEEKDNVSVLDFGGRNRGW